MKSKKMFVILALFLLVLVLTVCTTANPLKGVALEQTGKVYGFWNGLWDGVTAGFAFFNLFGGHYDIYQVHNNGNWYDFGFLLGIVHLLAGRQALRHLVDTKPILTHPQLKCKTT